MRRFLSIGIRKLVLIGKFALLPVLGGIFPILFYYANNLGNLGIPAFSQLGDLFTLLSLVALAMFLLFYLITKGQALLASIASFILVIFFNVYGIIFTWLRSKNFAQVEHYLFIPLYFMLAIYLAWLIGKLLTRKNSSLPWNICMIIVCSLIVYNGGQIALDNIKKARVNRAETAELTPLTNRSINQNPPDIYFFIFDEFAGFEAMRDYWKYDGIIPFEEFLRSKGFFIADESHSRTQTTLAEIASRLNYEIITSKGGNKQIYYDHIDNNKVMQFLKGLGYSTVVFNGLYYSWSTPATITADYSFLPTETVSGGHLNDEFEKLVLNNTLVKPFLYSLPLDNPVAMRNRSMIFYTLEKITQLNNIPSPKFVYVHLMFPHTPFLFSANGEPLDPQYYEDWDYYLGNYEYCLSVIKKMVTSILDDVDPTRPPVIILQSDHGARNGPKGYTNYLKNYPEQFHTSIMNAMFLPGCDTAGLPDDLNPINTFPIVFNCYYATKIPLK